MKVLMINGSPNDNGCTKRALNEIETILHKENIETEIIDLGKAPIRDCVACRICKDTGKCVFIDDIVNETIEKASTADGFIFGSPVYYAHPSGRLISFLDRVFYAGSRNFAFKPAAAIVSARRAGTSASIDVINKYFMISNMPIVPSNYWNMVHGNKPEQVEQDLEGLQTMRIVANNMIWMLKSFELAKQQNIVPTKENKIMTNFIR